MTLILYTYSNLFVGRMIRRPPLPNPVLAFRPPGKFSNDHDLGCAIAIRVYVCNVRVLKKEIFPLPLPIKDQMIVGQAIERPADRKQYSEQILLVHRLNRRLIIQVTAESLLKERFVSVSVLPENTTLYLLYSKHRYFRRSTAQFINSRARFSSSASAIMRIIDSVFDARM